MEHIEEKRNAARIDVSCEIYCKPIGMETLYKALCVTLSGTGISFISEYPFEVDTDVEVKILPETVLISELNFFITIARCRDLEDGNFEIGAIIHIPPEETNH